MAKKKGNSAAPKSQKRQGKTRLLNYLLLFISLAVIVFLLGNYHYIRTPHRTLIIHKLHFGFQDTYLDIRKWSTLDLYYHAEVEQAIRRNGGETLLNQMKKGLTQVDE